MLYFNFWQAIEIIFCQNWDFFQVLAGYRIYILPKLRFSPFFIMRTMKRRCHIFFKNWLLVCMFSRTGNCCKTRSQNINNWTIWIFWFYLNLFVKGWFFLWFILIRKMRLSDSKLSLLNALQAWAFYLNISCFLILVVYRCEASVLFLLIRCCYCRLIIGRAVVVEDCWKILYKK